jgi:hypothetical protein
MVMTTKLALCPDGVTRVYSVENGVAFVLVRGHQIEGKITEEDGVTKFRQAASHPGAHRMWHPPPGVADKRRDDLTD